MKAAKRENEMQNTSEKTIHRTLLIEWLTILGAIITCFSMLYSQISSLDAKMTIQAQRTDKLYEMFISLLRDAKS